MSIIPNEAFLRPKFDNIFFDFGLIPTSVCAGRIRVALIPTGLMQYEDDLRPFLPGGIRPKSKKILSNLGPG